MPAAALMNEVAESGPLLFSQFLLGVGEGVVGMDGAKLTSASRDKVLQKLGRHQALALRKCSPSFNLESEWNEGEIGLCSISFRESPEVR